MSFPIVLTYFELLKSFHWSSLSNEKTTPTSQEMTASNIHVAFSREEANVSFKMLKGMLFEDVGYVMINAELERKTAAAMAVQDDAPLNQPDTSTRRHWARPRGSKTRRHGDTRRGITLEFPQTLRGINLRTRGTSSG
uniref:Uncharacterized protein n=1 Tax=Cannabis sativa TaxID=3483 RepID=A0A803PS69_CANSA